MRFGNNNVDKFTDHRRSASKLTQRLFSVRPETCRSLFFDRRFSTSTRCVVPTMLAADFHCLLVDTRLQQLQAFFLDVH